MSEGNRCNVVEERESCENGSVFEKDVDEGISTLKGGYRQQTVSGQNDEYGSRSAGAVPDCGGVSFVQVETEPRKLIGQENQLVSIIGESSFVKPDSDDQTVSRPLKVTEEISTCLVEESHQVLQSELATTSNPEPNCTLTEQQKPSSGTAADSSLNDNLARSVDTSKHPCTGELGVSSEEKTKDVNLEMLGTPDGNAGKNSGRSGRKNSQNSKISKKKYPLRSVTKSERVLRSRSQEAKPKASESNNNLARVKADGENSRKKRKKKGKKIDANEYSRIRKHLRYLLHRISYENNLIDAYSAEGWKGLSLEKLKPERELQRAKSEIIRYKLKIRGLFQRIDTLSAEGKLPESLFDSEGEIDSEDIFCAKCGFKDVSADNDILLCDGACDRGFHQYCLEPPLLKEDIPSGDEGWLCPACDCKIDCIDLVDDSFGTKLSISDSWEKVFPEVVVGQQNDNNELSSDESDDDYNPDGPNSNEEDLQSDSSSDESEYGSASEGLGVPAVKEQYLGLPSSDDSEDDDFNPDAPDPDVKDEKSSGSDFTSASEDLGATPDADKSSGEGPICSSLDVRPLRGSKPSLKDELKSLQQSDPGQEGPEILCGRRHINRLDYKRLYDETYGHVPSSSSDDEDFSDVAPSRKNGRKNVKSASNGEIPAVRDESSKQNTQKLSIDETNHSLAEAHQSSPVSGSNSKRIKSSAYRFLGESVTKKLYQSFKDNQYPKRETKESLAAELGLTVQQVSKWFENARWSARHSSRAEASLGKCVSKENTSSQTDKKELGLQQTVNRVVPDSGDGKESSMAGNAAEESACEDVANVEPKDQESCKEKFITRRSSRLKRKQNEQPLNTNLGEEDTQGSREGPSKLQTGERAQKRRSAR